MKHSSEVKKGELNGRSYNVVCEVESSLDANPGDTLTIYTQGLNRDAMRLEEPKIANLDRSTPRPYSTLRVLEMMGRFENSLKRRLSYVKDFVVKSHAKFPESYYQGMIAKRLGKSAAVEYDFSKQRADRIIEEEGEEGGREHFNVQAGDKGELVVQEHLVFLSEEEAKQAEAIRSYTQWKEYQGTTRGSLHVDVRIQLPGAESLQGFTIAIGNSDRSNWLINPENKHLVVSSFKNAPIGKFGWMDAGAGQAWALKPGHGAPAKQWAAVYRIDPSVTDVKGKVEFTEVNDYAIVMKIYDTELISEGEWILSRKQMGMKKEWILEFSE